jgi:hypothetical protein
MKSMPDADAFAALQAENARLTALLESHGIDWRVPTPSAYPVREFEPSKRQSSNYATKRSLWRAPMSTC